jgi:hypothetical protein
MCWLCVKEKATFFPSPRVREGNHRCSEAIFVTGFRKSDEIDFSLEYSVQVGKNSPNG